MYVLLGSKLVVVAACRRSFQCNAPPVVYAINCSLRETVRTSLMYLGTLAGRDH